MGKVVTKTLACVLVTWGGAYSAQKVAHTPWSCPHKGETERAAGHTEGENLYLNVLQFEM